MAKTLFVSEQKLKDDSYINANVDNKLITPLIIECQDYYILPIIGTGIFNEIVAQIAANTLTVLNKTLLDDYVVPCLIKFIQYEAPIVLNYKFSNANVSTKNTDESVPVSLSDAKELMDRLRNKAEWYGERITKYLITNMVQYPLFTNPGTTVDTIHPHGTNYTTGMWLGKTSNDQKCTRENMTNMKTSSPT